MRDDARRAAIALVLIAGSGCAYIAVQRLAGALHPAMPELPRLAFERAIPFVPAAMPLYASLGLFLLAAAWRCGRGAFRRLVGAALIAQLVAYAVFLAWPMRLPRPELADAGVWGSGFALAWRWDDDWNTLPSLHVADAVLGALAARRRWAVAWGAAIVVSVPLVGQHALLDSAAGAALGVLAWLSCRPLETADAPAAPPPAGGTGPTAAR